MTPVFDTGLPATGDLQLQVCGNCGQVNYPRRELCGNCLADALDWQTVDSAGTVQSLSELHYSLEPVYAANLPWRVASVKLACGQVVFAHLSPGVECGQPVTVCIRSDSHGNRMLVALDEGKQAEWLDSIDFREDSP